MDEEIVVYLPDSEVYIVYFIGDGSNLLREDIQEGFVDYIYFDVYSKDDFDTFDLDLIEPIDGGMLYFKERVEEHYSNLTDAVVDVIEIAGYPKDAKYELPVENLKELKMKSTGKNISEQFVEVLYKLENTNTPLDDAFLEVIERVPEVETAILKLNSKDQTINLNRIGLWKQWASLLCENKGFAQEAEIVYNNDVEKGYKAFLVLGLPASGKSSVITTELLKKNKAVLLDSDEAKKIIPEYDDGWGASAVHEESKEVNLELQRKVLIDESGSNVVIPIVGSKKDQVQELIGLYKDCGYSVSMHLVEVKAETSMSRLLRRFINDNRFIPPRLVKDYGNKPSEVFEELKGEVDEYVKWSNEVKHGEPAICICRGGIKELSGNLGEGRPEGNRWAESTETGNQGKEGKVIERIIKAEVSCELPWSFSLERELVNFAKKLDYYHFCDECRDEEEAYRQIQEAIKSEEEIKRLEDSISETVKENEDPEIVIEAIVLLWRLNDIKAGTETVASYVNKEVAAVKLQLYKKLAACDLYFDSDAFSKIFSAYAQDHKNEFIRVKGEEVMAMTTGYTDKEIDDFISSDHFEEVVCKSCKMVGKLK